MIFINYKNVGRTYVGKDSGSISGTRLLRWSSVRHNSSLHAADIRKHCSTFEFNLCATDQVRSDRIWPTSARTETQKVSGFAGFIN